MWTLVNIGFASGYSFNFVTWSGVDEWIGDIVVSEGIGHPSWLRSRDQSVGRRSYLQIRKHLLQYIIQENSSSEEQISTLI